MGWNNILNICSEITNRLCAVLCRIHVYSAKVHTTSQIINIFSDKKKYFLHNYWSYSYFYFKNFYRQLLKVALVNSYWFIFFKTVLKKSSCVLCVRLSRVWFDNVIFNFYRLVVIWVEKKNFLALAFRLLFINHCEMSDRMPSNSGIICSKLIPVIKGAVSSA